MSVNRFQKFRNIIIWALIFAFSFGIVVSILMFFSQNHGNFDVYEMNNGWDVSYCGHYYHNVDRNDSRFDDIKVSRNDVMSMSRTIDIRDDWERLTLRLYSRLSSVRVSIVDRYGNEEQIFYYGYVGSNMNTGDFLGSGYHFIQLPQDCNGKTLKIMEMASQDDAFKGMPDMLITESDHAMEYFAQERSLGIFVAIFMIIAGFAVAVISVFMVGFDRKFYNITIIGFFSALSGLWCMCSMKTIELFSLNIRTDSIIEYISLYMMTIPLMMLAIRFFSKAREYVRTILFESMIINIVLALLAIIFQLTGIFNINKMLPAFHIIIAFDAVSLTIVSVIRWKKARLPERFFETGIFFAAAMSFFYIIYFYLRGNDSETDYFEIYILPIAILFMVIMMIMGYLSDLYIRKVDDVQQKKLVSLAYTDQMTSLYNRTMGEQKLHEIDESKNNYLLINMDLNFLKKVNDQLGHAAGDQYIMTCADIMKEVFGDADAICRMGGDEFMIVYSSLVLDRNSLKDRLDKMVQMENNNSDFLPVGLHVDVAYGYVYSDETRGHDSAYAYRIADERMYRMKRLSKKGRVD